MHFLRKANQFEQKMNLHTHISLLGLGIQQFEFQRCYQSNMTHPDPESCSKSIKSPYMAKTVITIESGVSF